MDAMPARDPNQAGSSMTMTRATIDRPLPPAMVPSLPTPPAQSTLPWPSLAESLGSAAPGPDVAASPLQTSEPRPRPRASSPVCRAYPAAATQSSSDMSGRDHFTASALTLALVSATDSLKLPNDLPHHLRDTPIWSTRISPVLESLQSFASLAVSLPRITGSNQLTLILQPQVNRLAHVIDSCLGALFHSTTFGGNNNGLDLLVAPATIRKAAAQAAMSPVPVPLANVWDQYLIQDAKQALDWVVNSAGADGAKIQQALQWELEQRQPDRDAELAPEVPDHERVQLHVDVALAADEPARDCNDSVEAQCDGDRQSIVAIVDQPAANANAGSEAPLVCDSPRRVTPMISCHSHTNDTHLNQPAIPSAPSPEALTALSQVYTHLHQVCASALTRLASLQPPPTLRADLESEIYRARLEHVLWSMYLGQSGGMLSAALEPTSLLTPLTAPVLNVMPTLTQVVAPPPQATPQPLVLTRSRIPVPVRHVIAPATAAEVVDSRRRRHRVESVSSDGHDEQVSIDSEYASDSETDADEIYQDEDNGYREPEPPRGKVIRGGGATSLKLPKPNPMFASPTRPRANTLDTLTSPPLATTRKPRALTRGAPPPTQPPWSISSARRPRSTSTNASTSTFGGGGGGGRVRPRVSSHRETLRSPSPTPSTCSTTSRPRPPPPHLLHSPTSPTHRTLSRPASTPSLLAAMSQSHSTPSLATTPYGGAPGFFPPFIPAGNLGLGEADVAKQRVYNRLSSWHVSGREADKIAERQAVYEERFRAAAFAAVAAGRMAAGVSGGRESKVATAAAAAAGAGRDQVDQAEEQHDHVDGVEALVESGQVSDEVEATERQQQGSSGPTSRAVSPAAGGVVRSMVEQIEQIQIGDEQRQVSHTSGDD